jgi:predicted NUDIX family NTP pyrophosphohydrolase
VKKRATDVRVFGSITRPCLPVLYYMHAPATRRAVPVPVGNSRPARSARPGNSMAVLSAGIIAYRRRHGHTEVLLVHPGGPFWRNKDLGSWSIPKGEVRGGEDVEAVARREFAEELGLEIAATLRSLGEIRQRGGKRVQAFAAEFDVDADNVRSNTFEIEWPPRSGRLQSFPEVDRAAWFSLEQARERLNEGQRPLLVRLEALVGNS